MKSFKTISITLFCLLLHFCIRGQNSLFFNKYYNIGFTKGVSPSLLKLEDSTYIVLNYGNDSITGQQNIGLFRIDKFGSLIQKKNHDLGYYYLYYNNGFRYFIDATQTSLFITSGAYISGQHNLCFTKINKYTLDTIKTSYFNDGLYYYYLNSTLKITDNKFLLVGAKSNSISIWPTIVEMDSSLLIKNIITCSSNHSLQPVSALINPIDKKLIMAGTKYEGLNAYGFIAKYDTLGNFIDSVVIRTFQNGIAKIIYSPIDNTYITLGVKETSVYGSNKMYRIYICKYNANLNLVWSKVYGKSNLANGAYNAVINTDGSILAVGKYSDSITNPVINKNYNGIMLKIRTNGDSLWMKQFDNFTGPNNYYEGLYGIERSFDGGYIACGDVAYKPKSDAWVVKTDSLGCDLASCMPSGVNEEALKYLDFVCYPNPNNGNFIVEYKNLQALSNHEIVIIDIVGQEILKIIPSMNKTTINNLPSGIYFIELRSKESKLSTYKVVVTE